MIGSLPWTAWLLVFAAVGIGLTLELFFFLSHRRQGRKNESTTRGRDDR